MKATMKLIIYWMHFVHEEWNLYMAATSKGLFYVGSQNKPLQQLTDWAARRYPDCSLVQDDKQLQPYTDELIEFFTGKRNNFTVSLDFHGTPFQLAVWDALCKIPYGQTKSYSDIAHDIQKPAAIRAVGAAIGANPLLIAVPCHRVIGKNGALTGYRGGLDMKTQLLQLEREG